MLLEPQRQIHHIFVARPRVCGDKVRNQILLFTRLLRVGVEQLFKAVIAAHSRLHHLRQRPFLGVLRRNLQVAADVVRRQLFDIARIFHRQVVTHAGGNQDFLDAFQVTGAAIQVDGRRVVGIHMRTDFRIHAGEAAAGLLGAR